MSLSKITRNYQITIPVNIRKSLKLKVGHMVDFDVKDNKIILSLKKIIDEDQSWFWTEEWQKGEKEVTESLRKKEGFVFKNVKEMRKHFDA